MCNLSDQTEGLKEPPRKGIAPITVGRGLLEQKNIPIKVDNGQQYAMLKVEVKMARWSNGKKIILTIIIFLCIFLPSIAYGGGAKTVWVNAYTKSDGTYVSGHYRSPPSSGGISFNVTSSSDYVEAYNPYHTTGVLNYSDTKKTNEPEEINNYKYKVKIFYSYPRGFHGTTGERLSDNIYKFETSGSSKESFTIATEAAVYNAQEILRDFLYERYSIDHQKVSEEIKKVFSESQCNIIIREPIIDKYISSYSDEVLSITTTEEMVMTCTGYLPKSTKR